MNKQQLKMMLTIIYPWWILFLSNCVQLAIGRFSLFSLKTQDIELTMHTFSTLDTLILLSFLPLYSKRALQHITGIIYNWDYVLYINIYLWNPIGTRTKAGSPENENAFMSVCECKWKQIYNIWLLFSLRISPSTLAWRRRFLFTYF